MRLIFQAVIIVLAIGLVALSYPFARDVTARNTMAPTGQYVLPYQAQGKTVYISGHERNIFYLIYGLTAVCLIGQLVLYLRPRLWRPAPSSETP